MDNSLLRELRDSLHSLQMRIDSALDQTSGSSVRRCNQCSASLVGKRSDARICGSAACKKSAKEERIH